MRRRDLEDSELSRQSVRWYPTEATQHPAIAPIPQFHDYHYPRMLIEDVRNNVMPYRGMTKRKLDARIEPGNDDVLPLIEKAISDRGFRQNLYEVVANFGQECASWMMTFGKA